MYEEPKRSQMRDALEYAAVLVLLLVSQTGCGQAGDAGQAAEAPAAEAPAAKPPAIGKGGAPSAGERRWSGRSRAVPPPPR